MLLISSIIFGVISFRQKQFDQRVYQLQELAFKQMTTKEPTKVRGNYSGNDIETLQLSHLTVDPQSLIDRYGVGMISIPSINLQLPILEGITQENLSIGVGTVRPNQKLGEGNFVLLGHYMTNKGLLFGGLKQVEIGDTIQISFYQEDATYVVQETKVIHQSEGQYMLDDPSDHHWLTLLTCDGSRIGTDYRVMVRATIQDN